MFLLCAICASMVGAPLPPDLDALDPETPVMDHPDGYVLGTGYYRAMATFSTYGDPSRKNKKEGTMHQDDFFEVIDNKVNEETGENFLKMKLGGKWVPTRDGDFKLVAQVTKETFDAQKPLTAESAVETPSSGDGQGPQVVLQKTEEQEHPPRICGDDCTYPSVCYGGVCTYRPYKFHNEAKYKCVGNEKLANPQIKKEESSACEEFEGNEEACLELEVSGRKPCAWEKDVVEWYVAARGGKHIVSKDRHMRRLRRHRAEKAEREKNRKNGDVNQTSDGASSFLHTKNV